MYRLLISLALLCTAVSAWAFEVSDLKPTRVLLTWNGDPASTQNVTWRTEAETTGAIEFAPAAHGQKFEESFTVIPAKSETIETTGGQRATYHTGNITGLKPSSRYMYRVGNGTDMSEWNQFETASASADPFEFIYVGDAQNDVLNMWSRVIRQGFRDSSTARFVLHAGDLINYANYDNEWDEWFEATGFIHRMIPAIAIPGNHEMHYDRDTKVRSLSRFWQPQFEYPDNGLEDLDDTSYYIDYQGVRIVGLNSNVNMDSQAEWLDRVLSENKQKWTILTLHHPIYSAAVKRDNPDIREALLPIVEKHKVDLVLQGHDHTYGRSALITSGTVTGQGESGTVYVVSVSGPKQYDLTTSETRALFDRVAEDTMLYQTIRVDGDKLNYVAKTAAGTLYDGFELVRTPTGNKLENKIPSLAERRRAAKK